jgi:hypothetical protein
LSLENFRFDKITEDNNICIKKITIRDFYEIIIVTIYELLDKTLNIVYKEFEKFSHQKLMQSFILFLTKKEVKIIHH